MRLVSYVELYVCFRRFFGGPISGGAVSEYVALTFAAGFKEFRKVLTHLLSISGIPGAGSSGHLTAIGIHVPQACLELGFPHEEGEYAHRVLQIFVGNRPIVSAQGFSKPFCL